MKSDNYVRLFANCKIVSGFKQSLLCDLQKQISYFVPNELNEMSKLFKEFSVEQIESRYNGIHKSRIKEIINFLIINKFAFTCSKEELQLFPELSLEWDYPATITNAIVDLNSKSKIDFVNLFEQFENLGCRDIQIRIYDEFTLQQLADILHSADGRTIKSIQLFVKDNLKVEDKEYLDFVYRFPRITSLFIHSSEVTKILEPDLAPELTIAKISMTLDSHLHCGIVDQLFFATTLELFTESQHHNTCLNRKIGIDVNGDIRNCPSLQESYGNISNTTLLEAISKEGFKQYWNISKDQIAICKDCEFRHICTDCRGFLEKPEDIYSKPLKCGYDPYTATWSDWSKNPLKQKSIEFYKL